MNGHHLILGSLSDYLTGETVLDTHDERYRQKLAMFLVEEKGYAKHQIVPRTEIIARAGDKKAIVKADFLVFVSEKAGMIVKYGPGSLVTRRRSVLAASRLAQSHQIPIVVVTNGENAEIIDGHSGNVRSTGLEAVPDCEELAEIVNSGSFREISPERAEKESRILYAYEIDNACPCDNTVCRL